MVTRNNKADAQRCAAAWDRIGHLQTTVQLSTMRCEKMNNEVEKIAKVLQARRLKNSQQLSSPSKKTTRQKTSRKPIGFELPKPNQTPPDTVRVGVRHSIPPPELYNGYNDGPFGHQLMAEPFALTTYQAQSKVKTSRNTKTARAGALEDYHSGRHAYKVAYPFHSVSFPPKNADCFCFLLLQKSELTLYVENVLESKLNPFPAIN